MNPSLLPILDWILHNFGTGGILIAYFLWERRQDKKDLEQKKSNGEWIDWGIIAKKLDHIQEIQYKVTNIEEREAESLARIEGIVNNTNSIVTRLDARPNHG